jgi:PEP-CTERM motif
MKVVLIVLILGAFATAPAEAALYNWTIKGGFTGSGTFTTSNTPDVDDPTAFLVTAMTGTFNGSTITRLDSIGILFADNLFYTSGLHVDDSGWTWHAGTRDYNMFLSEGFDANGPTENLLIGFPGISGGSKKITFTETAVGSVPEPATLGLFGMGVICLGLTRRRKAA